MQKSLFHTYEVWKFVFHPVYVFHITVVLVLHICYNYIKLGVSEELELLTYTFLGDAEGEGGKKSINPVLQQTKNYASNFVTFFY